MSPRRDGPVLRYRVPAKAAYPSADRPWVPETYGIGAVDDGDRHGRAVDLLWVWLAANIGIIGIVYGAVVAALGLDLVQALLVALAGSAGSFVFVGVLGVAGVRGGQPMLALSRRVFGRRGNFGPALVSWVSLLGWEAITAVVALDALVALLPGSVRGEPRQVIALGMLGVVVGLSVLAGRLGHATIVVVQRLTAWVFGLATLALAGYLVTRVHWASTLLAHPASPGAVMAAVSVVAASAGVSWVNVSADYSRYLPRSERAAGVVGWTTLGASVPLAALVVVGFVLSSTVKGLASSSDPIQALLVLVPGWAGVPYVIVAVVGLLAQMIMGLYSSGLSLLALGVRVRRTRTVLLDAGVVLIIGGWMVVAPSMFLGSFVSFVELLACPISAWAAVFLVDMALRSRDRAGVGSMAVAVASWFAGSAAGLAFTSSPLFSGPLAVGVFAHSSLGYFVGATVAAVLFASHLLDRRRTSPVY